MAAPRRSCRLAAVPLAGLLAASQLHAATYWVAQHNPAANDANDGSQAKPWKTLARAASAARAGDTVLIGDGVYRETVMISASGAADRPIRFQAVPAAHVVVTGADLVGDWKREPGTDAIFSTSWAASFVNWSPTHTHPGDDYHLLIGRCEQVFVLGQPLRQVLSRSQLARGTFYADLEGKRLYAWAADGRDLGGKGIAVEASTRETIWTCTGQHVETRGLVFRYAANHAQQGAAVFTGRGDVVEDCTFELTNGVGASFGGPDITVRGCIFRDNGQLGFGAGSADRLHFTGCTVSGNNAKGFDRGWEAGGDKIVLSRDVVLEHSTFVGNHGNGIWFDIGNENPTVRNCLIADNEDAGIFYEISFGLHACDNVIVGNGFAGTPGAWGAEAGIAISSSPGCVVERNLLVGNKEGFNFREQGRTTPRIGAKPGTAEEPVWVHDETVRNNVIAYNRDAQTWGWFDVLDDRIWPAAMRKIQPPAAATRPATDSLETLNIRFENNLYALRPGEQLFHWGAAWRRNKPYATVDAVRRELKLEQGSEVGEFLFGSFPQRDFRVPADSPALRLGCYPRGDVPGVRLGTLP